jgi:hypothetical protein
LPGWHGNTLTAPITLPLKAQASAVGTLTRGWHKPCDTLPEQNPLWVLQACESVLANTLSASVAIPAVVPPAPGTQGYGSSDLTTAESAIGISNFRDVLRSVGEITPDFSQQTIFQTPPANLGAFNVRTAFQKPADAPAAPQTNTTDVYAALLRDAPIDAAAISPTLLALLGDAVDENAPTPETATAAETTSSPATPAVAVPVIVPQVAVTPTGPAETLNPSKTQSAPDATPAIRSAKLADTPESAETTTDAPRRAAPSAEGTTQQAISTKHSGQAMVEQLVSAAPVPAPRPQAVPLAHVPEVIAIEARKLVVTDTHEFTIRLDPANLGRIDVRLEVKPDGYVTAVVQAEKSSTYDMMRQDARGFEQSLNDSGLRTNSDSLNFTLRRDDQSVFADMMSGKHSGGQHAHTQKSRTADSSDSGQLTPTSPARRVTLSSIDVMA